MSRRPDPPAAFLRTRLVLSPPTPHTCSKLFEGYPCCHRQWRHNGHCRFVHGYSRSFLLCFAATHLDSCGFVVDFSSLKPFEHQLSEQFDHTFLVNADDPLLKEWTHLHELGALDLRVMSNVGMETTAELIWTWANQHLLDRDRGRTCCWAVEARENTRNAAWFHAVPDWFSRMDSPSQSLR